MALESAVPFLRPVWDALQLADAAAAEVGDEKLLMVISDACNALVQIRWLIRDGEVFDDRTRIRTGNRTGTA